MQTPVKERPRPLYTEYDRITIPENISELGVKKGQKGVVRELKHDPNSVTASVMVTHSTNQTKGWVDVQVSPRVEVSSYTVGA